MRSIYTFIFFFFFFVQHWHHIRFFICISFYSRPFAPTMRQRMRIWSKKCWLNGSLSVDKQYHQYVSVVSLISRQLTLNTWFHKSWMFNFLSDFSSKSLFVHWHYDLIWSSSSVFGEFQWNFWRKKKIRNQCFIFMFELKLLYLKWHWIVNFREFLQYREEITLMLCIQMKNRNRKQRIK